MFRKYQTTASVSRKTDIKEGAYTKSPFVATGKSYIGHLKAQSIEQSVEQGGFGKVYKFTTQADADIIQGDRLIIEGKDYDVKGVSEFNGVTFSNRQILLNRV